jgi:hypothetical protein
MNILLISLVLGAHAAEKPIVLSAERDNYGQGEQQALVFHEDHVVFSRNSNFLCGPSEHVRLGAFSAAYDADWKAARQQAEQMFVRLNQSVPDEPAKRAPHAPRLFVGVRDVTGSKAYAMTTRELLRESCDGKSLSADNAVEVSINKDKRVLITRLSGSDKGETTEQTLEASSCKLEGRQDNSQVYSCRIKDFGTALIVAK